MNNLYRWLILLVTVLPLSLAAARPNVVFILADDLGWTGLGCYGSDLHQTPHLDRLAREGVRFNQAYAMSVCSPTRAAVLTGKHAARLHFTVWRENSIERDSQVATSTRPLLPPITAWNLAHEETTLAESLQAAGYLTFHVGKWHLGDTGHAPESHGFNASVGATHWGAPATYFHPFRGSFGREGERRHVPGLGLGQAGDYLTDRLTDEAIKFIEAAGERPFFLNLWFHTPHTPIEGKPEWVEYYRQKVKPTLRHQNPDYAAMIHSLDENVGRILAHLEAQGLSQNTLVVFTSDNGGAITQYDGRQVTNNSPLRSGKGSLYEGGIRVPLIFRLPGLTRPDGVCEEPVTCMDLYRTLAGLAGAAPDTATDGMDLVPLLREPERGLNREALFFHYPHYYPTTTPVSAVRAGPWKLLEFHEDNRLELYHLKDDLSEAHDLAAAQPQKTTELVNRLKIWRAEAGAQLPLPNPHRQ